MQYLTFEKLIALYTVMMRDEMNEGFYGVLNEGLVRSALARPENAAEYEGADGLEQAAYLFHGLLMNHGFAQGNKRIAYLAMEWFLHMNKLGSIEATDDEIINMVFSVEEEKWEAEQVTRWLRHYVRQIP